MTTGRDRTAEGSLQRRRIIVEGIVQGVGFRPFIYQLARRFGLTGSVRNDTRGVTIEVEGEGRALDAFAAAISDEKPPLAVVQSIDCKAVPARNSVGFTILASALDEVRSALVPPDTFVCDDCLLELFDPSDRRYRYPFINCTNCGPRYTIVTGIPYDRPLTTMGDFPLCRACRTEYEDPASRRFHAQPNACPECGPQLRLLDATGKRLAAGDPLAETVRRLGRGEIVAIKGLGGFHLAVDAASQAAVCELRRRKQRDEKPFALMARDLDVVRQYVHVGDDESRLLSGPERPIVLLQKRSGQGLADNIAPDNRYLGFMLPYTPLHHLLFRDAFDVLVMTSANLSDEPIAFEDDEALTRLAGIADAFLVHNRRIHTRTDDSIARLMAGKPLLLRRSRGFVPRALALPAESRPVLAVGAELKTAVCLTRGDRAFLSQHIGDLKNLDVYDSFRRTIAHLKSILQVNPELVAHDLHPDYYSSRYAEEESDLPSLAVQHHHAHMASCLVEHGLAGPTIGVIFDGAGFGTDGHVWGGEFLVGDLNSVERIGHFLYQPMPGGDLASREPWRMALSYLMSIYGEIPDGMQAFAGLPADELRLVAQAVRQGINAPLTSSCGRLFDAVAALLGLRQNVTFEGQAAMQLEMIADPDQSRGYPYRLVRENSQVIFDPSPLVAAILDAHDAREPIGRIAGRFHFSLAVMIEEVCVQIRRETGLDSVVLSGGVFQNALLTSMARKGLEAAGFAVYSQALVPPNDGGLALGQAAVAGRRWRR